MAVNKVIYGNSTLIDLTADTVTADKLAQGITAHDKSGAAITGTMVAEKTNCKTFSFTSSEAVANQTVTVVSGDPDVAAHYADENAMATIRKITNNNTNGLSLLANTNHTFGGTGYGVYMNYNGTANNSAPLTVPLNTESSIAIGIYADANGDISVRCARTANNFGGAEYIITFSW